MRKSELPLSKVLTVAPPFAELVSDFRLSNGCSVPERICDIKPTNRSVVEDSVHAWRSWPPTGDVWALGRSAATIVSASFVGSRRAWATILG